MKEEEVRDDNKLIMKFMGYLKIKKIDGLHYEINGTKYELLKEPRDYEKHFYELFCNPRNTGSVKFNFWNELMPVVERIESLIIRGDSPIVTTSQCSCEIEHFDFNDYINVKKAKNRFEGKTKHEATYKAVVAFLEWYNLFS